MARLRWLGMACLVLAGCTSEIGKFVRENGYSDFRPPSKLLAPGSIVYVSSQNPLTFAVVCSAKGSLGGDRSQESPSAEIAKKMKKGGGFKLDADYLSTIKASAKFHAVSEIKLTMSDVKIHSLANDVVFDNIANRSEGCKKAIADMKAQNPAPQLAMVREVIEATAAYTISFTTESLTEAKADIIKGLAVSLGADVSTATDYSIKGTNLYWGLTEDKHLAEIDGSSRMMATKGPVTLVPANLVVIDVSHAVD